MPADGNSARKIPVWRGTLSRCLGTHKVLYKIAKERHCRNKHSLMRGAEVFFKAMFDRAEFSPALRGALSVIPAEAGIQVLQSFLDPGLRRGDAAERRNSA